MESFKDELEATPAQKRRGDEDFQWKSSPKKKRGHDHPQRQLEGHSSTSNFSALPESNNESTKSDNPKFSALSQEEIMEQLNSRTAYLLLYQLRVRLEGVDADIWRLLVVSSTVTLENLVRILCTTLKWDEEASVKSSQFTSSDGQKFAKGKRGVPSSVKTKLCELVQFPGHKLTLSIGAWKFSFEVDKVNRASTLDSVPRCVDGASGAPLSPFKRDPESFNRRAS